MTREGQSPVTAYPEFKWAVPISSLGERWCGETFLGRSSLGPVDPGGTGMIRYIHAEVCCVAQQTEPSDSPSGIVTWESEIDHALMDAAS